MSAALHPAHLQSLSRAGTVFLLDLLRHQITYNVIYNLYDMKMDMIYVVFSYVSVLLQVRLEDKIRGVGLFKVISNCWPELLFQHR